MGSLKVVESLKAGGIIAIIRGDYPGDTLLRIVDTLVGAGVTSVEVTLNSRGALQGIAALRARLGTDALIGAGTVRTEADVRAAISAGAQFLVSPNFDPASVAASQAADVVHLPGVFTASEAQAAHAAGCRLVKLFPADALGPRYLRALRAPLDDVGFVPTGGIDERTIGDYVAAGAVAFGVGSGLVRPGDPDLDALAARAQALVRALDRSRGR